MRTTCSANANGIRFPLGRLLATPGVLALGNNLLPLLRRHARGDWGDLGADDRDMNERAVADGERILSAYDVQGGQRVWI
jgi:hypothetical protein